MSKAGCKNESLLTGTGVALTLSLFEKTSIFAFVCDVVVC